MEYEERYIEPSAEFVDPSAGYLQHMEACARNCYKSEDRITKTSARPFVQKVARRLHHVGILEHVSCIMRITHKEWNTTREQTWTVFLLDILVSVPLFGYRLEYDPKTGETLISGNLRMWEELIDKIKDKHKILAAHLSMRLHDKFPELVDRIGSNIKPNYQIRVLDDNPLTNRHNLTPEQIRRHMTMTYKVVMCRSCSHQWVRHRLSSYMQTSQRYVDYCKKSFSYIIPPTVPEEYKHMWIADAEGAFNAYEFWRELGMPPEDAREKLANETSTSIYTTSTIDNWFHMFKMRADNPKAQHQIRNIMLQIKDDMKSRLPQLF